LNAAPGSTVDRPRGITGTPPSGTDCDRVFAVPGLARKEAVMFASTKG